MSLTERMKSLRAAYQTNVEGARQRVAQRKELRETQEATRRRAELDRLKREEAVLDEKLQLKRKREELERKKRSLGGPFQALFGEKARSRPRRKKGKAKPKDKKKAGKSKGGGKHKR